MSKVYEAMLRAKNGKKDVIPWEVKGETGISARMKDILAPRRTELPKNNRSNGRRSGLDLNMLCHEEEIKLIRRLFVLPGSEAPRSVVFSGAGHGCGCSWVCTRATETLTTQLTGSVCLVDANLRSPSLHRYFGVDNHKGLTDAVGETSSVRDFAHPLLGANYWFIAAGSYVSDPHSVLTSDALRSRIRELQAAFDYVLFDAPPVSLYPDAVLLGRLTGGVILVVEANTTQRGTARICKDRLENAKVRLLGAVWSKCAPPIQESL